MSGQFTRAMTDERRKATRQAAEVKVDYRTVGGFITDYTDNLSRSGVFVYTSLPLPADQEVRLRITLPGDQIPLALMGVVRWTRTAAEDEDNAGMGIEFTEVADDVQAALDAFMERVEAEG